jgi:hypothetical protein
MSSTDTTSSASISAPSANLKTTGSDPSDFLMEPVGVELTTDDALELLAKIYKMVKLGVKRPEAVRLMIGNQQLRIQHNTDVIVRADLKSNGTELWTIVADHEIRRIINPDYQRLSY